MARHRARQVDPSVNYRASAAGGLLLVAVAAAGTGGCGSRPTSLGGTGGIDAGGDRAAGGAGGTAGAAGAGGRIGSAGMTGAGGALPTDSWQVLEEPISRKVDILFMIDNSQSMLPLQTKLLASFPVFMNVLKTLPMGLPDLHVAVISSDTGPGRYDLPDRHCAFTGDGGRFKSVPGPSSACSPPLPSDQHYLATSMNQTVKNYAGDITDAFTCIAALGDQGCGFEGQLKAVRWALDPINPPDTNLGFLRPEAYLAVILLTNEDDCSLPDDSDLVDPAQTRMSDPLGPFWSFRCNEFGHLCNINGTLQRVPRGPAMSNLQGCVSNETATGKLTHVTDEVAFLKALKGNPNQILVSAISGPATPYSLEMIQYPMDIEQRPNIVHSCTQNSGEFADPGVRIQQWAAAFGSNGVVQSICASSFGPALQVVANKIGGVFAPACVNGPFPMAAGAAHPACRVVDRSLNAAGARVETLVPSCLDNGNAPPCWTLQPDTTTACRDGQRLAINRGSLTPPPGLTVAFSCTPCVAGTPEIGCP